MSTLVSVSFGTVFCNLSPLVDDLMVRADKWSSPLCALFFVISGAELELGVFADVAIVGIGVVYILARCLGKYYGAHFSAKATGCSPAICKYLGITLFAILIYEVVGPMMTKQALIAAGDIKPMSEEVKNRRENKLKKSQ